MRLRKDITSWGLLMTSLGAMIGSGWLFGALYAAQIAGPASIFSWIIGGFLLIIIGLNFAELSTALPLAGGISRYTHITHGSLVSFTVTWLAWLPCVATAPTEAQAILEYSAHYLPWTIYSSLEEHVLTLEGWGCAIVLIFLFSVINLYAIKAVLRFNNLITYWKLFIPVIVIVWIFCSHFEIGNFTDYNGFAPFGIQNILWAIPAAGIIFSYLGFRECISMAGETKNPKRAVPLALIGSVIICTVLYVSLQIILIGALTPDMLSEGWSKLSVSIHTGPLASIAIGLGIFWLAKLIYIDALISPAGTAVIYTATTARLNYGISANKYLPEFMMHLTKKGVPLKSIIVNFFVGILLLVPLPTWQKLVAFQSTAIVLSYGLGPVCLIVLRRCAPDLKRPFVLPGSMFISMITFYICTLIAFWTGWNTMRQVGFAIIFGLLLMLGYRLCSSRGKTYPLKLTPYYWFILYVAGITLFSCLGSFGGGLDLLPFGWDFVVLAIFSVIIFKMAIHSASPEEEIKKNIYSDPEYIEYMKTH